MKFRVFLFVCCLLAALSAAGQARRMDTSGTSGMNNGLGATGQGGLSNGSAGRDSTVQDRKTPKEVLAWHLDGTLGEVVATEPDTVIHRFQNVHLTEGMNGEYNHLGNIGSPRQSRIFTHRTNEQFIFAEPMDYFAHKPEQFYFLDTKAPYTNVTYYRAGNQVNGEERIKGTYGVNAGKRIGLGFNLDYVLGRGRYSDQTTALFDASTYGYYRGDRYTLHLMGGYDKLKWAENGGITDDRYITRPEEMASGKQTYTAADMPVHLERMWNELKLRNVFLEQHVNIGYYKARTDSLPDTVMVYHDFMPVMKVFHTAGLQAHGRRFIDYKNPSGLFANQYLPYDSIDATGFTSVKNTAGLTLLEGVNKWIPFGASAYVQHEWRGYTLPDSVGDLESVARYNEQNVTLGGNLRRTLGDVLHFNVTAETTLLGTDMGCFNLQGQGNLNFRLLGDSLHLAFDGYLRNSNPSFYYRHYHSQHYWWDNDLEKEFRTHIGGSLASERLGTHLSVGVDNILNYTYLDYAGYSQTAGTNSTYLNDIQALQCNTSIQVLSATLEQDFAFGIFHWDNEVTAQYSSRDDILPLPLLNVFTDLYLKFTYAKVLRIQLGADVRYFTAYYAPDYAPALGMYHLQNKAESERMLIGNYPIANLYANFHLKQVRFYAMYCHANDGLIESMNQSFLVPHYPINPHWFKLGLSWNFWD